MPGSEGDTNALKHGGEAAVKAIQRGEQFTGLAAQEQEAVETDLAELRRLLLQKNKAYQDLERARRIIDRRTFAHRMGKADPVPDAWLVRVYTLEEVYHMAKQTVREKLNALIPADYLVESDAIKVIYRSNASVNK
jgi:hypothetical protein